MVKITRRGRNVSRSSNCKRWGILAILILFIGSISFLLHSYFAHNADNSLCNCPSCVFNRTPEEGEYVYNRYLIFISLVWIAVIFAIVFFVNYFFVKKEQKAIMFI